MPTPATSLWDYYHTGAFRGSDIDLFIYGLTIDQANKKVSFYSLFILFFIYIIIRYFIMILFICFF